MTVVHAEDWPHGLRCGECHQLLNEGDLYSQKLTGMADDVPVVLIVCTSCALSVKATGTEGGGGHE